MAVVREVCLEAFEQRIPKLKMIADGYVTFTQACPACGHTADTAPIPVTDVNDMRLAIDTLAKYGMGDRSAIPSEEVRERLVQTLATLRAVLPPDDAQRAIDAIRPHWTEE